MKKFLLMLSSMALSLTASAQWTKPQPVNAGEFKYSTMGEGGDTIVYYLYNQDADAFFTEGNDWGTRASIGDAGLKVAISKYIALDDEGNAQEWDGKSVVINDYSIAKNGWRELFMSNATDVYVDRQSKNLNYMWELDAQGGGVYRIAAAESNPDYKQSTLAGGARVYFGQDSNTKVGGKTHLTYIINPEDDPEAAIDWYFVTEEAYAAYAPELERYNVAGELKALIDSCAANYPSVSTSAAQSVYANTSSSKEQLQQAITSLDAAIKDAELSNIDASEDNPYDATVWITNPKFDTGDIRGWDATFVEGVNASEVGFQNNAVLENPNSEAVLNGFMQAWDGAQAWNTNVSHRALGVGQLSQTIANMPQGKYKFTVDAIACYEPTANVDDAKGVELFALGGSVDIHENIATIRQPERYEITFINTGGDITLGVRTTEECTVTWIALDNFTLTYYGKSEEDPEKIALTSVINDALSKYPLGELEDLVATQAVKDEYETTLAEAQGASSDYEAYVTKVRTALSNLKASAEAYAAYKAEVDAINEYTIDNDLPEGEAADKVLDYVQGESEPTDDYPNGTAEYILNNLLLTTEEITAETTFLRTLFNTAKYSDVEVGDVTRILVNPSFEDGVNGWDYDKTYRTADPKSLQNIAEGWNFNFDIYQTFTGLPNGIYRLQAQAFYREEQVATSSYENYIADPEAYQSPAYIYLNNTEQSINSIAVKTFEEGEYEGGFESVADGVYLPNNPTAVGNVFAAGLYDNEVMAIVTDGTLKVGIKSVTATGSGRWVPFDNFRLTYLGDDAELYAQLTSTQVEALRKYVEDNQQNISAPVLEAANAVIASAADVATVEQAAALIEAVSQTTTAVRENVTAVTAYPEGIKRLTDVLTTLGASGSLSSDYPENVSALDTEAINALLAKIGDDISNAPAAAGYTAKEGVIVNPTFDENIDGWTNEFVAGTNATDVGWQNSKATNTAAVYEPAIIENCVQAWAASGSFGPLGDGKVYQTLSSLPAGKYALVVDVIASDQSAEPAPVTGAYLYAQEGTSDATTLAIATDDYQPETFFLVFVKETDDTDLKIGFYTEGTTANWIACDNFRLYAADPTAINDIADGESSSASAVYSVSGSRMSNVRKGVNIIKMHDKTVKKVFVK